MGQAAQKNGGAVIQRSAGRDRAGISQPGADLLSRDRRAREKAVTRRLREARLAAPCSKRSGVWAVILASLVQLSAPAFAQDEKINEALKRGGRYLATQQDPATGGI